LKKHEELLAVYVDPKSTQINQACLATKRPYRGVSY
jgi:hypothetical protein